MQIQSGTEPCAGFLFYQRHCSFSVLSVKRRRAKGYPGYYHFDRCCAACRVSSGPLVRSPFDLPGWVSLRYTDRVLEHGRPRSGGHLEGGVEAWNRWREENLTTGRPQSISWSQICEAQTSGPVGFPSTFQQRDLSLLDLTRANLSGPSLNAACLVAAIWWRRAWMVQTSLDRDFSRAICHTRS
jgi:hypothetical protein